MAAVPSPSTEPVMTSATLRALVALAGAVAAFSDAWDPSQEQLGGVLVAAAALMLALGGYVRSKVTPLGKAAHDVATAAVEARRQAQGGAG